MSLVLSTGKRVTIEEVAKVATLKHLVSIDEVSLQLLEKELGRSKADVVSITEKTVSLEHYYPETIARAAILCRVVSLLQGKSGVRPTVIILLVELLNNNIIPQISSEKDAGEQLMAVLTGRGYCTFHETPLSSADAFQQCNLVPIDIYPNDVSAFMNYPFIAIGTAILLASGSTNLMKTVDAISALSCEAFGVHMDAFDAGNFEISRQHRGQILSSSNMRMLLEGSNRVNTQKDCKNLGTAFHNIPQIHGPCYELITATAKSLDIELNSSENGVLVVNNGVSYDRTQVLLAIRNLTSCLRLLAEASMSRELVMSYILDGSTDPNLDINSIMLAETTSTPLAGDELIDAFALMTRTAAALNIEINTALAVLSSLEVEVVTAKCKELNIDESAPAIPPSNAVPTEDTQSKKVKIDLEEADLTPEQKAKIEAKRKAKAEKAAAKAAAKESKKKGGNILVLGMGTSQLREFASISLKSLTMKDSSSTTMSAADIEGKHHASLVKPFDFSEEGLPFFSTSLLEKLTSGGRKKPKIPKGTRDYVPEQMRIREQVFSAIRRVFKRHGGVEIDTPVFELKEILTGKYGEDSKLIYDLADQGGEMLSLRYDLTVPFARFLAMNSVGNIKRYHIAKVYRRDQPQLARGRYREFYQCDFDVAGSYFPMVPDAEVITVASEILTELPVGSFLIKLNHRKLLDAIFEICGVPAEKFRPICSAVDKLDKASWEEVRKEMVEEKGLPLESANKIGEYVLHSGKPKELLAKFVDEKKFGNHKGANEALTDLAILFNYLEAMGSLSSVSLDMSLARGLDYYTGVIYEAVLTEGTSQVGSIAAGGRYDNLVGMFSPAGIQTPCVGVSIGIERVFTIMEKKAEKLNILQSSNIEVFIASIGANLITERMRIANLLWKANISSEYSHQDNPKFKKQLDETLERGIPFMIVFGQDELDNKVVKLKDMKAHTEEEVPVTDIVNVLMAKSCRVIAAGADLSFIEAMKK